MNKYIAGVSYGLGGIEAVLLDGNFATVEKLARPYIPKLGRESIISKIEKTVTSLPNFHQAVAVGVALPAVFDSSGKKVVSSPIKELEGADIYQMLSRKLNLPIFIQRREFCSILAERAFGAAKEFGDIAFVEIGRDVGAAFVVGGKVYRGKHNASGNIREMVLDITREKRHSAGSFGALVSGEGIEALTGRSIYQILKENPQSELVSKQILKDLKESLLTGLVNIKMLFDPEIFILSGDILENFSAFEPSFIELGVKVKKSPLGKIGPAVGAAIAGYNAINNLKMRATSRTRHDSLS